MAGGKKTKAIINGKYYPMVSVCTPTFNRRPFIPIMLECFRNQTYPKSRMEWIIVDDGTDKVKDLIDAANISQIKYFSLPKKVSLGEKRNYMHTKASGNIIVYMDDDDYYPPERVEHAVDMLNADKNALCAGSSEIYIYFKHIQQMYQCGPYSPTHATAGTFAFRAELLKQTRYDDHAALAEEKAFLKNYTVPFVQLDPMKTILVFSHNHNTFDKRKLLENPNPQFCKPSPKTVDMFIRTPEESHIKQFFMKDIDALLENYAPGKPNMKPDVLKQIKEIENEREQMQRQQMMQQQQQQQMQPGGGPIKFMMNRPDGTPVELTPEDILRILQQQQGQLDENAKIIQAQNDRIREMVGENTKKNAMIRSLEKERDDAIAKCKALAQVSTPVPSAPHANTVVPEVPEVPSVIPEVPSAIPEVPSAISESSKSQPLCLAIAD